MGYFQAWAIHLKCGRYAYSRTRLRRRPPQPVGSESGRGDGQAATAVRFKQPNPNLMVENVNHTVDFYRDVLGFEVVLTVPDEGPFEWALLRRGDVEILFHARGSLGAELPVAERRQAGGALTYYVDVQDVGDLFERLKGAVPVLQGLHTTCYGTREFTIEDVNGFLLTFAENGEVHG